MPAVDLPRVRRQAIDLAGCLSQPLVFRSALRQILEETSNRAYRAGPRIIADAPPRGYHTPKPVLRELASALLEPASYSPHAALETAGLLWPARIFEEQFVAAQLLGLAAPGLPEEALKCIEAWLPDLDSDHLADGLAGGGFCPLVRLNPVRYLGVARGWTASPHKWTRRLAVATLLPLARDRNFENVPAILDVLKEVMADPVPAVRKAAVQVLLALGPRSPAEVSRFLREKLRYRNRHTAWIIERVLPALDEEARASLTALLRDPEARLPMV